MEGPTLPAALTFGGPAKYANLVVPPSRPSSGPSETTPEKKDGFLRHWQVSTASVLPTVPDTTLNVPMGVQPPYTSMPSNAEAWRPIKAETNGLVNFSREVGSAKDGSVI